MPHPTCRTWRLPVALILLAGAALAGCGGAGSLDGVNTSVSNGGGCASPCARSQLSDARAAR